MRKGHNFEPVALILVALLSGARALAQCDTWLHGPAPDPAGLNSFVFCQTVWDPDGAGPLPPRLVVGGEFTTAGGQTVNCIAQWDGSQWLPLGSGMSGGLLPRVEALAVFNSDLIAGGSFTTAGGVTVNNIARWNVTAGAWQAIGTGATNEVLSLAVFGGGLFAGGNFLSMNGTTCNHVARWNGESLWSSLGTGASNGTDSGVQAMTVWNGQLVLSGIFTHAGGLAANRIATWSGSAWGTIGSGFNNRVESLCVYDNSLFAGGNFTASGATPASGIAFWNGTAWQQPGTGLSVSFGTPEVYSMTVFSNTLYVSGRFDTAGGVTVPNIAEWGGSIWTETGPGPTGFFYSLGVYNNLLIAGGNIQTLGQHPNDSIFTWDLMKWSVLVPASSLRAFAVNNGNLIAGGDFTFATPSGTATRLVSYDGVALSPIGTPDGPVYAVGTYNTQLIVGGLFTHIPGAGPGANNIAARNPDGTWTSLAQGFNSQVSAVLQRGGELFATGLFATAGGNQVTHIARWNGFGWQGLSNVGGGAVGLGGPGYALCLHGGNLVVGGGFTSAGAVANCGGVANWDGSNFSRFGIGTDGTVYAVADYNGQLIAAGQFGHAGGQPVNNIAAWDGTTWQPMHAGLTPGPVRALAVINGVLYAGGDFGSNGSGPVNRIARWQPIEQVWHPVGDGTDYSVYCLQAYGADLHVGGAFRDAGDAGSPLWARVHPCPPCSGGDGNADGVTDARDIAGLVVILTQGGPPGPTYCAYDMNGDGVVDLTDLSLFIALLVAP